jgi:hypothetical protein
VNQFTIPYNIRLTITTLDIAVSNDFLNDNKFIRP